MITCPECGQEAPDDAKFCDRCGQGLSRSSAPAASSSPTRPTPLTAGASLKGGIEIVALTGQTSIENRYRAKRIRDGHEESIALRERLSPNPPAEIVDEATVAETPKPSPRAEDPNGPSAKTAELKPAPAQTNGTASAAPPPHDSGARVEQSASADASGEGVASAVESDAGPASTVMADAAENSSAQEASEAEIAEVAAEAHPDAETNDGADEDASPAGGEDLGEVFGRVLALSLTISHPAFQRATEGFAENGRVYLVYADEELKPLRARSQKMSEPEAIAAAVQVCQAISFRASPGSAPERHLPGIGCGRERRPAQADRPRLRQQRQRASGRADFQRRLHRARDLSRQKSRQARGYFFGRRAALHLAHGREDSERELARRGGTRPVLSAACGYAAAGERDSPRDRLQSRRALADDRRVQGRADCAGRRPSACARPR